MQESNSVANANKFTPQPSPVAQAAESQPTPHSEPWYGHQFKEVRRGYWQCSCGKAIAEAAVSP